MINQVRKNRPFYQHNSILVVLITKSSIKILVLSTELPHFIRNGDGFNDFEDAVLGCLLVIGFRQGIGLGCGGGG